MATFNTFVGAAKRPVTAEEVRLIAGYLGVEVAALRAVIEVEAAGRGFGPDGRPIILNEPHVFYRQLGAGVKRDLAVKRGLAYRRWGTKPYPKTQAERYDWLDEAMKIDETAALESCSWGMGQVVGFNHNVAGYLTVQDFVRAMMFSEGAQVYAMARFIVGNNLQRHMRARSWASFAKGYNGSGYKKNKYDTKLATAYANRPASEKTTPPPTDLQDLLQAFEPKENVEPTKPAPPKDEPPTQVTTPVTLVQAIINAFKALFGRKL